VPTVVVGPERAVPSVTFVLEKPRFGGPVAGLRAAIDLVQTPAVAVLAVDLPFAVPVVRHLVGQWRETTEVLVPTVDDHDQYVCSVFTTTALQRALAACGDSMRSLFAELAVTRIELTPEQALLLRDIDTPGDLELLERNPLD
jgi:molybdopterin-guanine dinucleotide biosynthesis protein A